MKYYRLFNKDLPNEKISDSFLLGTVLRYDYKNQIMYYARTGPFVPTAILFNPYSLIINRDVYMGMPNSPLKNFSFYKMNVEKIVKFDWLEYIDDIEFFKNIDDADEIIEEGENDIKLYEKYHELYCLNGMMLGEYHYNGGIVKIPKGTSPHFFYACNSPSTTLVSEEFKEWLEKNNFATWLHFVETSETVII